MTATPSRFSATPIGANLAARDGGMTLSTLGAGGLSSSARSDIACSEGVCGVEFAAWGDDPLIAAIGVIRADAALSAAVGEAAGSVGWSIATGEVRSNGATIASGLPAVAKGDIVGLRVLFGSARIEFYHGGQLVRTVALSISGAVRFAASLASSDTGTLALAVNAGQYVPRSPAAAAGWTQDAAVDAAARVSDLDWLDASHARYEGLLVEGITTVESLGFWPWGEQPGSGGAEATVVDADDRIADLVIADAVGGTPVALRSADRAAGAVQDVARYRMEGVTVVDDVRRRIRLADAHDDLDRTLSRGVFLPNVPSLAWKPLPVVIGAVASVPALSASSDGTVRFLSDAPVSVAAVMDRGDLMESGTVELSPDSQQLLMTTPPVGPVVCDCSSIGIIAGSLRPATLQQALGDVFGRIGKRAWSSADAAAIDAATGYAGIGYYAGSPTTVRGALLAILNSYGAWYWRGANGTLRFSRVVAPESVVASFAVSGDEMAFDLVRVTDAAPGLTRRVAYRLNAQALGESDMVTDFEDVPQARRDQLTALWRGQVYAAGALPARYAHADSADPFLSVLWRREDAQAEAERIVGIYSRERAFYECTFQGTLDAVPRPGDVGTLTYPRYGLDGGKRVLVRRVTQVHGTGEVRLVLWG